MTTDLKKVVLRTQIKIKKKNQNNYSDLIKV